MRDGKPLLIRNTPLRFLGTSDIPNKEMRLHLAIDKLDATIIISLIQDPELSNDFKKQTLITLAKKNCITSWSLIKHIFHEKYVELNPILEKELLDLAATQERLDLVQSLTKKEFPNSPKSPRPKISS